MFSISRQGTFGESAHQDNRSYHDKYVIHYDFSDIGLSALASARRAPPPPY